MLTLESKPANETVVASSYSRRVQLTTGAFLKLQALDETLIGTADYMGIAFFWSYAYRHTMRDLSAAQRKTVHDRFRKAGLALDGESDAHASIVDEYRVRYLARVP